MAKIIVEDASIDILQISCSLNMPAEVYRDDIINIGFFKSISKHAIQVQLLKLTPTQPPFHSGEFIKIQFVFQGKRYLFASRSLKYFPKDNSLKLETPSFVENIDIRKHARYEIGFSYKIYLSYQNKVMLGFVKDMSKSGLVFSSLNQIPQESICPFGMVVPTSDGLRTVIFSAKTVYCKPDKENMYKVGLDFIHLRSDSREYISKFIKALEICERIKNKKLYKNNRLLSLRSEAAAIMEQMSNVSLLELENDMLLKQFSAYASSWERVSAEKKIFYIESETKEHENLQKLLSESYKLYFTKNILRVVLNIRDVMPDLILSEVELGSVDFFTMRAAVEKCSDIASIPFAVYTKNNNKSFVVNVLANGSVCDYIIRPIVKSELIVRLDKVIESASAGEPAFV